MDIQKKKMQILLIDDEEHIIKLLEMNLRTHGYDSLRALTGEKGLSLAESENPDLILLDVMLPGIDGVEVCRRLKNSSLTRHIPVLMLSAKSEGPDKISGLEGGADDYITKPFSMKELLLRIKAALRQVSVISESRKTVFIMGNLQMNTEKYLVSAADVRIDFTLTEFRILHLLLKKKGQEITRKQLSLQIFDRKPTEMGRTLDVHIRNIRKKLTENHVEGCLLETVWRSGYRLAGG